MPKGTRVERCYTKLKGSKGKGSAAAMRNLLSPGMIPAMRTPIAKTRTDLEKFRWISSTPDWEAFMRSNPQWDNGYGEPKERQERIEGCAWGYDDAEGD